MHIENSEAAFWLIDQGTFTIINDSNDKRFTIDPDGNYVVYNGPNDEKGRKYTDDNHMKAWRYFNK